MQSSHHEESSTRGKELPRLFYCRPVNDAPDCDGRSSCLLQLQQQQKTKNGDTVKHQDHFRCTITCGFYGKRRHYEDECHIKRQESEKLKTKEEDRRRQEGRGNPPKTRGGGLLTPTIAMTVRVVVLAARKIRINKGEAVLPQPPLQVVRRTVGSIKTLSKARSDQPRLLLPRLATITSPGMVTETPPIPRNGGWPGWLSPCLRHE